MSATAALLDFAAAAHRLPPAVRDNAERLLADTLAVGAAGATAPGAEGVRAAAALWGGSQDARVIALPDRLPAPSAAFVNGFQIHCLEWDAVHEPAVVHALSAVTAVLLAVIDRRAAPTDPDEALTALAVGVDIAAGLGLAAESALSFFRPATAGCIGAALAAARLEGITRDRLPDVLGLAYSFCAGTMQAHVEGSIALPLQIANAARSAVMAVDLVKAGLTGPHDALEGPMGYFRLFDQGDLGRYTRELGHVWRISEVSVKPFPSGRASHATLDLLSTLRSQVGDLADIEEIEVIAPPLIHRLVSRPMKPEMTPAYARLCLPFLAGLMLSEGRIDPRRFTPATFSDPDLIRSASWVRFEDDGNPDPNALRPQSISIKRKCGEPLFAIAFNTLGDPAAFMTAEQMAAKLDLARELALPGHDSRIFDQPLAYFTDAA